MDMNDAIKGKLTIYGESVYEVSMFQLTKQELESLKCQIGILYWTGWRYCLRLLHPAINSYKLLLLL